MINYLPSAVGCTNHATINKLTPSTMYPATAVNKKPAYTKHARLANTKIKDKFEINSCQSVTNKLINLSKLSLFTYNFYLITLSLMLPVLLKAKIISEILVNLVISHITKRLFTIWFWVNTCILISSHYKGVN